MIAIIGILVGLLLQGKGYYEGVAKDNMQQICAAQHSYHSQNSTYADSLTALQEAGLIHSGLASGTHLGYHYVIFFGDADGFLAVAHPEQPGVTGDLVIAITQSCELETTVDPDSERQKIGIDVDGMETITALIRSLDPEAASGVLQGARTLVERDEFGRAVQHGLDVDGDGALSFEEILGADLFALARSLAPDDRSPAILPDEFVQATLADFQARLRARLRFVQEDEELARHPVPLMSDFGDDARRVLGTYESLRTLHRHFVSNAGIARALDRHLDAAEAAESRGNERAKQAHLAAYARQVSNADRFVPANVAEILIALSRSL